MTKNTIVILATLLAGGCGSESPDARLEMLTIMGEWEPMATVYGYVDNYGACDSMIRGLTMAASEKGYSLRTYRCLTDR